MSSCYQVIIPPELATAFSQLSPAERLCLESRLDTLSKAAQDAFHAPPVLPHWLEVTDISPGKHRVFVEAQWMAYDLSDTERTLRLLDFGSWSSSPLPPSGADGGGDGGGGMS